jgi:hypothetical protein
VKSDSWLGKALEDRFSDQTAKPVVPKTDTVDVLGGGK